MKHVSYLPLSLASSLSGSLKITLALGLAALAAPQAKAVTNDNWDPSGNAIDSSGTWDTTTADWDTAPYVWNNASGYTATFGFGAAGPYTVTLSVPIVAGGVQFNAGSNYTIAGTGANTLTLNAGSIITANAASSTISAAIAGTTASVAGTGTLTLSGANTFSTTAGAAALTIGASSHVLLGTATTLQNEVVSNGDSTNGLTFQTGQGGVFTIGGLLGAGNIALQDNAGTPNAITLTLGAANSISATLGSPSESYTGVLSGTGSNLVKSGYYTQVLTGANTYSGTTTVNGAVAFDTNPAANAGGGFPVPIGTLQVSGSLVNTSGLILSNSGTFLDGSSTAASNNSVTNRVNSAASLTMNGGTFTLAAPAASNTTSQTLTTLTSGPGLNTISGNATTGTSNLIFSGPAASVYSRSTGGFVNFADSTGVNVQFTNAPTGALISGSGSTRFSSVHHSTAPISLRPPRRAPIWWRLLTRPMGPLSRLALTFK